MLCVWCDAFVLNWDPAQEIGWTHMKILEGVGTIVQLGGLVARLCKMVSVQSSTLTPLI